MSHYTNAQLEQALVGAKSLKQVMQNLGMNVNNGQYRALKKHYLNSGLTLPKFTPLTGVDVHSFHKTPDHLFFAKDTYHTGSSLRKRLIDDGKKYICDECGQEPIWNGKPLVIQVDHVDGDRFNNIKSNLQFLCPNCHTQTETYGSKNKDFSSSYNYCSCGNRIHKTSINCNSCKPKPTGGGTVIDWPPAEDVLQLVKDTNFTQAAKSLGVTDNAVRKFLKRNNLL